jgi:hypothetical protein
MASKISEMAILVTEISQSTLDALRVLIGRQIHTFYAPVLAVAGTHVSAPSFSVSISDQAGDQWIHRFLNFKSSWSETPRFLNDYWELQAFENDAPLGISQNSEKAMMAPCSVSFYENGSSAVTSIKVYTFSVLDIEDENESVTYDKVIQLCRDNGSSICLACQLNGPGIAEDVHLSEDPLVIQSFLDGCQLRFELQ